MLTLVLICGIVVSPVAAEVPCCCETATDACASRFHGADLGNARRHAEPISCAAEPAAAPACPMAPAEAPSPDADPTAACCSTDRCDTPRALECLRSAPMPPAMALDRPVDARMIETPSLRAFTTDLRQPSPRNRPLFLLKNAILC